MKTSHILFILFTLSTLLACANRACAQSAEFAQAMKSADAYEQQKQSDIARGYYEQALQKAQNDDERAQAQIGIARNTALLPPKTDPNDAGVARNAEYSKVLNLLQAPASRKAEAHLGMAEVQAAIGRYESASNVLTSVLQMPDALPEQKLQAALWQGEVLIELKQYENARAMLTDYLKAEALGMDEKIVAYRQLARSYLMQENRTAAQVELAKTVAFPDLKDEKIAEIYIANGDFLREKNLYAAARDEYDKVAILADASSEKNVLAKFQIGQAYFGEKNYAAARETWTQLLNMRGAESSIAELKKAIGHAYTLEGNYPAAREAYNQWLAVNGLGLASKIEAWQSIADTYVQEKNYAAARETLANIGQGAMEGSGLHLRQQFNIAEVYRAEGDFNNAAQIYTGILTTIAGYSSPTGKPSDHYIAQDMVWEAADAMAKEPASMSAAYTVYEALEKHYPYELQDAKAYLGMGDILLAQGKSAEAKAKYQKALELRRNYDEGKIAQEKIDRLEEKPLTQTP